MAGGPLPITSNCPASTSGDDQPRVRIFEVVEGSKFEAIDQWLVASFSLLDRNDVARARIKAAQGDTAGLAKPLHASREVPQQRTTGLPLSCFVEKTNREVETFRLLLV